MKLKHVLTEGPITYNGGDGQRFGAWEEPGDEPEANERQEEMTIKYVTVDQTTVDLKVKVSYDVLNLQAVIYGAEPVSVMLPSGKEVEIDVAKATLGEEEFDVESVLFSVQDHMENSIEGVQSVTIDKSATQPAPQAAAPATPADAPTGVPATKPVSTVA